MYDVHHKTCTGCTTTTRLQLSKCYLGPLLWTSRFWTQCILFCPQSNTQTREKTESQNQYQPPLPCSMEWPLIFTLAAFILLFPLFLVLCSEYLEEYIAGSSLNEDQEEDGGYLGMANEALNNHLVEALSIALHEKGNQEKDNNKVRRRRRKTKTKTKKKTLSSPRSSRFTKGKHKST